MKQLVGLCWLAMALATVASAQEFQGLANTDRLAGTNDLSSSMVMGIDRFLLRELNESIAERGAFWRRDLSSARAYTQSVAKMREQLRRMIGAVDQRENGVEFEFLSSPRNPAKVAESGLYTVFAVRWRVFPGVHGEGLWVQPKRPTNALVIALPDADATPEMILGLAPGIGAGGQFARHLADAGCEVVVPTLIDRRDTWSGNARLKRFTNQPHREWVWRQSFEVGRHIIGYEVQKVLALVDIFAAREAATRPRIGVAGYGEGGLIAFYAAAVDERIDATLVSGYYRSRQRLWEEPIYRDVFGLLREFGDAEIATLILPRSLIVEYSEGPQSDGPPAAREGRSGAAPGKLRTPEFNEVDAEIVRAHDLVTSLAGRPRIDFVHGNEGTLIGPGSAPALNALLRSLGFSRADLSDTKPAPQPLVTVNAAERQQRQLNELVEHTQRLLSGSRHERDQTFWRRIRATNDTGWETERESHRTNFWRDLIGRLEPLTLPANPRSRRVYDAPRWTGYDVVLDVWPEVFAWGVLLLPKDLKPGERRPVVVCQHGLEGLPADTIVDDPKAPAYGAYRAFSARLAERGFVVFAPHNPYRGWENFRRLQRKAHPLGKSLFSVIIAQHERMLDWLSAQPFVDPKRIGFYGLSYGGKTAMRVPAVLDRYCLSICSADFNEWAKKCATTDALYSYLFTVEYDMYEFDLAHRFNYAEMAALIAPRPFMVERGHHDGVAPDEWVAEEYARVRRFYTRLRIADRTEIEFFDGPHAINGQGTFRFLHRHLQWPEPR